VANYKGCFFLALFGFCFLYSLIARSVRGGMGFEIISTPNGILTGEEARKQHVGGEILFKVW
jgi:ribosomal protein S8